MKKLFGLLSLFALMVFIFSSCTIVDPNGDEEAVLVMKPLIFRHGGVEKTPVNCGLTFCALTTSSIIFKITPITITEEFDNMVTKDNTPVTFSAYMKVQIISGETPKLYEKFGINWYDNSVKPKFRAMVRDKSCEYKLFTLTSNRDSLSHIESYLFAEITNYCKNLDIPVRILDITIGAVTPPAEVLTETKNTAAQNQSKLTQEARANAELARKQAEINKAIADKAYQNQMSMTVEEYLKLRQLEIEKEKVELIKDNKNISIIFGNAYPTLPINK